MITGTVGIANSLDFPWMLLGSAQHSDVYGRRSVVVSGDIEEVIANVCDDPLPEVGRWRDEDGKCWKRFELPCADWQAGVGSNFAELTLVGKNLRDQRQQVILAPALPRPSVDIPSELDEESSDAFGSVLQNNDKHYGFGLVTEEITDNHVEYVNDLYDHQWSHRHYWEENIDGIALRSVKRSLSRWRRSGSRDEARLALIVKLAAKLPTVLQDVCQRPRVVLRRVREMLSVGRVQEVDASCLRWLARQPGRSIVEKAGTRQQVLGITRVEDADTPENRVVRDLLARAATECRRYLSENQRFSGHPRVLLVRSFRSLLQKMSTESPVGHVSPLVGEAQANYVLQHEPRYRQLWEAYLLLVHQQKQQENIWRWRERTWAEVCGIALWDVMRRLNASGTALRSDVFCRDEQVAGRFLDTKAAVASFELKANEPVSSVDIVEGSLLAQHPLVPRELRPLCPDFVVIPQQSNSSARSRPLLAIWTLLQVTADTEHFEQAVATLSDKLVRLNASTSVQGLILTPAYDPSESDVKQRKHLEISRLQMPLASDEALTNAVLHKWRVS